MGSQESHLPSQGINTPPGQVKQQSDGEVSQRELHLARENDELKRHREELRALCGFYKDQSESYKAKNKRIAEELAVTTAQLATLRNEAEARRRQGGLEAEWKERAARAEAELEVLKEERNNLSGDLDTYRTENEALKEALAEARSAGEAAGAKQAPDRPRKTRTPDQGPTPSPAEHIELDLEYVSDDQSPSVAPNATNAPNPWVFHPRGVTHPEQPASASKNTEVKSASPMDPRGSALAHPKASSSVTNVLSTPIARSRSPSLEILEEPPSTSHSTTHGPKKRVRKDNTKTMQAFLTAPIQSQPSAKALGKRKADPSTSTSSTHDHDATKAPAKKFKPFVVCPPVALSARSPAVANPAAHTPPPRVQEVQVKVEVEDDTISPTQPQRPSPPQNPHPQNAPPLPSRVPIPPPLPLPPAHGPATLPPRPKFKFKTEDALVLPDSTIARYLADAPELSISPTASPLHVERSFLRLAYGGSDQHFLQYISKDRNPSAMRRGGNKSQSKGPVKKELDAGPSPVTGDGKRRLVFPMPDMNPAMPVVPGHSGLLFASRHEVLENAPWGVFRRHLDGRTARWLYLGEYECKLVGKMTKEEFGAQNDGVKRRWAKLLMEQRAFECYTSMRARIALRKAGVLPVGRGGGKEGEDADDVNNDDKEAAREREKEIVAAEMARVTGKVTRVEQGNATPLPVTEEDIIEAFERGDEGIDIIRMQCVAYDHVFAQDIEARYPNFPKMLDDSKAKKRQAKGTSSSNSKSNSSAKRKRSASTASTAASVVVVSKRRRAERKAVLSDSDEEEGRDEDGCEGGEENVGDEMWTPARRSARVKSKPRKTWIEDSEEEELIHSSDEDMSSGFLSHRRSSLESLIVRLRGSGRRRGGNEEDDKGDSSYPSDG